MTLHAHVLILGLIVNSLAFALTNEMPGGLIQTAEKGRTSQYEIVITPLISHGVSLGTELRYDWAKTVGVGMGFLAGSKGFTLGPSLSWALQPDRDDQPAFAILTSLNYFDSNREKYLVTKITPLISKSFVSLWGESSPYVGLSLLYYRGVGTVPDALSLKTSLGSQFSTKVMGELKLWVETGFYFFQFHDLVFGVSYPLGNEG